MQNLKILEELYAVPQRNACVSKEDETNFSTHCVNITIRKRFLPVRILYFGLVYRNSPAFR